MLIAVLSSFIIALGLFTIGPKAFSKLKGIPTLLPIGLFAYFLSFIPSISAGETHCFSYEWVPSLGVNLNFLVDGLGLLFALVITGIGALVFFYSSYYLKNHPKLLRFYSYLSIFMGAMIGLVLSSNIISLFIFWELTSISSFYLIGFNNEEKASRKSALTALAVTGFGGMALLAFAVIAGISVGTYEIQEMLNSPEVFTSGNTSMVLLFFIFTAAFTKSAQFPFHFWLPGAMKAPTPVSTYLHSATMVKAGVYLLLRFSPHFTENVIWHETLIIVGGITMVYAAIHTLFRTDLKGILAYSTIAALGILVFLIGIGTNYALTAALVFIVVHALYKAALFLITGIIDHQTGTRDITKLKGLFKFMIPVGIAGIISALSSAGVPPFVGFVGKDLIYESTLHADSSSVALTTVAIITNILMVFAGFLVGIKPFIGKINPSAKAVKMPSPVLWIPPLLLAILSLLFGLAPSLFAENIITPALDHLAVSDLPKVKLWHGFNLILGLSLLTLLLGTLVYLFWKQKHEKEKWIARLEFISPKYILEKLSLLLERFSYLYTRFFQNGYLRNYVLVLVLVFVSTLAYHVLFTPASYIHPSELLDVAWSDIAIVGMMFLAIIFSVFSRSRLAAIAGLGIVGYCMCFIFVYYSAPDLAMTQFTIDTLTVILFVLVLYRLPKYLNMSNTRNRIRDGALALSLGAMISFLIIEIMHETPLKTVSNFYTDNAYILAKGKNIVNVILVDFRGFDTFIEIIVLAIAAIGVFGLLKLHLKRNEK
jgi:multicomponent Na+:H+ antiporter subunit A